MGRRNDGNKIKKWIIALILVSIFGGILIVPISMIFVVWLINTFWGNSSDIDRMINNAAARERDRINRNRSNYNNSNVNINIKKEPIVNEFVKDNVVTNIQTHSSNVTTVVNSGANTVNTTNNSVSSKGNGMKKSKYTHLEIQEKLEYYENCDNLNKKEMLEKISILNDMMRNIALEIEKEELVNNIKNICDTADKIAEKLKKDKKSLGKIAHFVDYYFPVTLKILIKYDEIENLELDTSNSKEFMESVEEKVELISKAFDKQLESLYESDFTNYSAELDVIEGMLKTDGYTDDDDFNMTGKK